MILKKLIKNGRLLQAAFAIALLVSLPSAQPQSQAPAAGSANSKPASGDLAQQPNKSEPVAPSINPFAAPTQEDPNSDQIEADIRKLHLLAAELRTEVGKTYKDSLSVNVLKEAKEIEILSRSLKERMDQKAAAARHQKQ
ncbi:MAG TPA: hypothetical protein VGI45_10255 [Terracidiphilus sp.]|jgi:hypothetical protein